MVRGGPAGRDRDCNRCGGRGDDQLPKSRVFSHLVRHDAGRHRCAFLFAGAAFLAVATVVVYAGAILVMFLFVLMLAQPEGHTTYDRRSWEAPVSAFTGAVLVGVLTATIAAAATETEMGLPAPTNSAATRRAVAPRGARARPQAQPKNASFPRPSLVPQGREDSSVASYDVARLGADLFTRYLVAVEAAGVLLFAALVGAAVIVSQGRAAMKGRPPLASPGSSIGGTSYVR